MGDAGAPLLREPAGGWPTPAYVYDLATMLRRIDQLQTVFGRRFDISYAVKANPNRTLLAAFAARVQAFDVSSIAEAEKVRQTDAAIPITFTGPGKRDEELLRFVRLGAGSIVLESLDEAESLARLVRDHALPRQNVLLRVNPLRVRRQFGAAMTGRGSQFGIDEEEIEPAVAALHTMHGLVLCGFHCYPATNGLNPAAVAESLGDMARLFQTCVATAAIQPQTLIFGAGFGTPYFQGEADLDVDAVAEQVNPMLDRLRATSGFADTRFVLELGRWIVAPAGFLLTSVVRTKISRGSAIRICDAGFNANMAACGMLGGAFRRNWRITNLTNPEGEPETCDLVGPLCTTLDHIATEITLPQVRKGDVLAIAQSGAYGLSASPTRFISHPEPAELVLIDDRIIDATESRANWPTTGPRGA